MKKLFILLPSGEMMHTASALDLANLFAYTVMTQPDVQVGVINRKGSILSQSREEMVEQALEQDASHVLFIDSDQTYPHDLAIRLLAHNLPVVGCNVATKTMPPMPTARAFEQGNPAGEPVYTFPDVRGLEKVWRLGTGIMLIATHVFKHLEKPWFPVKWDTERSKWIGEDWAFCGAVIRAGFQIHLDHDLSWEIGHIGTMVYDHQMVTKAALGQGRVTEDKLDRSRLSERRLVV